jgi:hypothetical protein
VRPVMAFLPDDLLGEVDRRARAAGVSRAEMLGRIFAEAVPRLFAELLNRLPERFGMLDAEPLDEPDAIAAVGVVGTVDASQGSDGRR